MRDTNCCDWCNEHDPDPELRYCAARIPSTIPDVDLYLIDSSTGVGVEILGGFPLTRAADLRADLAALEARITVTRRAC